MKGACNCDEVEEKSFHHEEGRKRVTKRRKKQERCSIIAALVSFYWRWMALWMEQAAGGRRHIRRRHLQNLALQISGSQIIIYVKKTDYFRFSPGHL